MKILKTGFPQTALKGKFEIRPNQRSASKGLENEKRGLAS